MSSKRPVVLMLILLVLLAGYLGQDRFRPQIEGWWADRKDPPLEGENRVAKLVLQPKDDATWTATIEYFYTGKPRNAMFLLQSRSQVANAPAPSVRMHVVRPAQRGLQTVRLEIPHPGHTYVSAVTDAVTAKLVVSLSEATATTPAPAPALAQLTASQRIDWPDRAALANRPEAVLASAVEAIEAGSYREAKASLEGLVARDPKFDQAYLELARIAMKTNWNPEGLRNAEALIQTALQVRPDGTNAKILLAYVYQHQRRFAESDALRQQVVQVGTTNAWHWANWGEWHELQGQLDPAIARYREGLAQPRTKTDNDRARPWMYWKLLALLEARSDWDGADALYRKRVEEYPEQACFPPSYADFLVHRRGDADAALRVLRDVQNVHCREYPAASLRGAAYYLKWASGTVEAERAEALQQARVFLPPGPLMFYQLARSDATVPAARKLIAAGEKVGLQNSQQMDALAMALSNRDLPTVRRLLKLGARTDSLVGEQKMPVALVPVVMRDLEAVRLLQQSGVDYARIRFQGTTALEHARNTGDTELMRALAPRGGGLAS